MHSCGSFEAGVVFMHAMVVDDSPVMRIILRKMLMGMGAEVRETEDGKKALARLEQGDMPHVMLLDWSMPEMDGYTLLQIIRGRSEWKNLKIVMVTGEEQADSVHKALAAGADAYLVKPFTVDVLKEKLVAFKLVD
jgi:two-component system chemotaxis response regulator CheY